MANCNICGKQLDNTLDALSYDCGGDCVLCMADCGDPECLDSVRDAVAEGKPTLDTEAGRIKNILDPKSNDKPEYRSDSLRRFMSHFD